jgi:hypothetical protein
MSLDSDDLPDDDSIFSSGLLKRVAAIDPSDQDVSTLETHVRDLSAFLTALTNHVETRRARYATELEALASQIDALKSSSSAQLESLLEQQESEAQSIISDQTAELSKLSARTENVEKNCELWGKLSVQIENVKSDLEASDLELQRDRVMAEQRELAILQAIQRQEIQLQESFAASELEMKVTASQAELTELAATERQQRQQHAIFIADCRQVQENLVKIHANVKRQLESELQRRDHAFAAHLKIIQAQLEREQHACENETIATKSAVENLGQLKRATAKKCAQQLQAATASITELSELLDQQQQSEAADQTGARASIEKTDALNRENIALQEKLATLEAQLARIREQEAMASNFLQRARTPTKPAASEKGTEQMHASFE